MKCLSTLVIFMTLIAGCATHYCRKEKDSLVLYLEKPGAQRVFFASSLDGFEPHEARHLDGRWVVVLPYQNPFRYYYVVDDEIFLPPCQFTESDDFGSENCIFDPQQ